MSIVNAQEIYVNLATPFPGSLLIDLEGTPGSQVFPNATQKDTAKLRIYLARQAVNAQAGEPPPILELDAGEGMAFTGRLAENLNADSLLFSVTDFEQGTDEDDRVYYEGLLDLNTDPINAYFNSGASDELVYIGELKPRNADNTERKAILRWTATIYKAVYRGTEGVPLEGDPVYPAPEDIPTTSSVFNFVPTITGRVGGTSTDLDALPLSALDAGKYYQIDLPASGIEVWKFQAGDDVTNEATGTVRHADWEDGTFEFLFKRRG